MDDRYEQHHRPPLPRRRPAAGHPRRRAHRTATAAAPAARQPDAATARRHAAPLWPRRRQWPCGNHCAEELERVWRGIQVRRHRLCRELRGRRLDHAALDRPAQALHCQPPADRRHGVRQLGRATAVSHQAPAQPKHARQQPEKHPRPLRPGRKTPRCAGPCNRQVCSQASACWRSAAAGAHWPRWRPPNLALRSRA